MSPVRRNENAVALLTNPAAAASVPSAAARGLRRDATGHPPPPASARRMMLERAREAVDSAQAHDGAEGQGRKDLQGSPRRARADEDAARIDGDARSHGEVREFLEGVRADLGLRPDARADAADAAEVRPDAAEAPAPRRTRPAGRGHAARRDRRALAREPSASSSCPRTRQAKIKDAVRRYARQARDALRQQSDAGDAGRAREGRELIAGDAPEAQSEILTPEQREKLTNCCDQPPEIRPAAGARRGAEAHATRAAQPAMPIR